MSENENKEIATIPEKKKSMVTIDPGKGLMPKDFDSLWRVSEIMAASGLMPDDFSRPESVFVAVQMGLEVGLSPMQAVQSIAVINGRPSIWGDAMLALVRSSGLLKSISETDEGVFPEDSFVAICKVVRKDDGSETKRGFSVYEAKKANLWTKKGPWSQYPKRMLQMRARSWALRDAFGEVLKGLKAAEEVMDYDTPVLVQAADGTFEELGSGQPDEIGKEKSVDLYTKSAKTVKEEVDDATAVNSGAKTDSPDDGGGSPGVVDAQEQPDQGGPGTQAGQNHLADRERQGVGNPAHNGPPDGHTMSGRRKTDPPETITENNKPEKQPEKAQKQPKNGDSLWWHTASNWKNRRGIQFLYLVRAGLDLPHKDQEISVSEDEAVMMDNESLYLTELKKFPEAVGTLLKSHKVVVNKIKSKIEGMGYDPTLFDRWTEELKNPTEPESETPQETPPDDAQATIDPEDLPESRTLPFNASSGITKTWGQMVLNHPKVVTIYVEAQGLPKTNGEALNAIAAIRKTVDTYGDEGKF